MSDHVYKVVEIVGSSKDSIQGAIEAAVQRAAATLREIRWFEVTDTRGHVEGGRVAHYQVTLKVGFTLESGAETLRADIGDEPEAAANAN